MNINNEIADFSQVTAEDLEKMKDFYNHADTSVSEMFPKKEIKTHSGTSVTMASISQRAKAKAAKLQVQQRYETSGIIQQRKLISNPGAALTPAVVSLLGPRAVVIEGHLHDQLRHIQGVYK